MCASAGVSGSRAPACRELRMIGKALTSTKHLFWCISFPTGAATWPARTATNLTIFSKPVPLDEMKSRLDILAGMGTSIIPSSGGEPLMHPEIDEVIGIFAGAA